MKKKSGKREQRNSKRLKTPLRLKYRREKKDGILHLLIDCNPICYASFFTMGELSYNYSNTGVIYGFLKRVLDLSIKFKTSNIHFFWDARHNYRKDIYPSYKEKRTIQKEQMEAEQQAEFYSMLDQMVRLNKRILPSIGFKNSFVFHGFEADDLIAHVLKENMLEGEKIIVSNDTDLFQLLNHGSMYLNTIEDVFTSKDFEKKYRIPVKYWVKAKSIGGCSSDEVKGIKGVADPKSPSSKALTYLRNELPEGKIKDRIEAKNNKKIIRRNRLLIKLPYNQKKIPNFEISKNNVTIKKLVKVFVKYNFQSLRTKTYMEDLRRVYK